MFKCTQRRHSTILYVRIFYFNISINCTNCKNTAGNLSLFSTGLVSLTQLQMKLISYQAISNGNITDLVKQVCKQTMQNTFVLPTLLITTQVLVNRMRCIFWYLFFTFFLVFQKPDEWNNSLQCQCEKHSKGRPIVVCKYNQ